MYVYRLFCKYFCIETAKIHHNPFLTIIFHASTLWVVGLFGCSSLAIVLVNHVYYFQQYHRALNIHGV